jgi:hypothetical protein
VTADHKYIYVGWGGSRDAGVNVSFVSDGKTINENVYEGGGVQLWMARLPQHNFGPRRR